MQVFCLSSLEELAPYAADWDRLFGGVPFRSRPWLTTWWRHYGPDGGGPARAGRLFVLCVFDETDRLVGLAPWYLDRSVSGGRALRPLGSGEVCSDYLSVLCQPGMEHRVGEALADYLTREAKGKTHDAQPWALLELDGIDADDAAIGQLMRHLAGRGNTVHRRPGPDCWRLDLPDQWDDYLAMLSKSHRKQLRRLERDVLARGRAVVHPVERMADLPRAMEILIELHQRRWVALGQPGCFASTRFTAFHREVTAELLRAGQLQLSWMALDGRPAAAEYHLAADGVIYAYQSGVDPALLDRQPGQLITMALIRRAIEQGYRAVDFLRGDEPYKPHWRAAPRPTLLLRVVPDRVAARLRQQLWRAGLGVKRWVRSGLRRAGPSGR